jgi:hypothetical protein
MVGFVARGRSLSSVRKGGFGAIALTDSRCLTTRGAGSANAIALEILIGLVLGFGAPRSVDWANPAIGNSTTALPKAVRKIVE